jgi:hypothetical protein
MFRETCLGDAVRIGADLKNLEQNNIGTAVVFDSHGHGLEECLQKFTWLINDTDIRKPSEVEPAFYESFRSMSPQTGLFSALRADGRDPLDLEKELLCAGLTPVVVLDERFQRLATQPRPEQYVAAIPPTWQRFEAAFSMQQIWKRMRIYVPLATECGLEAPALDSEPGAVHKGIREYLECLERTLGRGVHVIVHQTIFEKLGRQEQRLVEILGAKASKLGWVNFVCSGRGMPWQLQGNDWSQFGYAPRFVPLSELLHCLEHMPSKVHLVRLLEVKRAPPSKLHH